ncbi:hypothetical protein E8E13_009766 [Curvularia kusanoi]|uniref:Uncharacterized protein n=1 Tax=Curvularia kusanoi TaxID=90978 RepID=A0A9P4WC12_CURKU|nr:hypothetical protein E8E13_009766 [Curvularia kusanoi]
MTNPFGDETYRIEHWLCPTCRYRNIGSSERLYNLRRNGRYYFNCEIATCGAGLVARQKANAPVRIEVYQKLSKMEKIKGKGKAVVDGTSRLMTAAAEGLVVGFAGIK